MNRRTFGKNTFNLLAATPLVTLAGLGFAQAETPPASNPDQGTKTSVAANKQANEKTSAASKNNPPSDKSQEASDKAPGSDKSREDMKKNPLSDKSAEAKGKAPGSDKSVESGVKNPALKLNGKTDKSVLFEQDKAMDKHRLALAHLFSNG